MAPFHTLARSPRKSFKEWDASTRKKKDATLPFKSCFLKWRIRNMSRPRGILRRPAMFCTLASPDTEFTDGIHSSSQIFNGGSYYLLRLRVFIPAPKLGFRVCVLFFLSLNCFCIARKCPIRFDLSHLPAECVHIICCVHNLRIRSQFE